MLEIAELAAVAHEMKDAQDRVCQISPFSSRLESFDVPCAYAVADLIHRERVHAGAAPVGRKIGFSNPDMWATYGVREPIWGYVYDDTVVFVSGGYVDSNLARFVEPKIEPEIVLHFHTAPALGDGLAGLLAAIDWIAHGFEIVQSHFPGWQFRAADTIADGGLHARLLVGEPQPIDRLGGNLAERLGRFSLSLFRNDALRDVGTGANVLGNPLLAACHLLEVLEGQARSEPLRAGELVTTGTITAAHPVNAGEFWRTEVDGIGLPGLTVQFT